MTSHAPVVLDIAGTTLNAADRRRLKHPLTGEAIWFNQLSTQHNNARSLGKPGYAYIQHAYQDKPARPYDVRLGDGSPISEDEIAPIYDA